MDKIRTKIPRDRPHDIAVWQNRSDREVCGRLDRVSVLLLGHWSVHFFLVLAWAPVVIQHCKSRHLRNGHVQNFSRQDVDVAGVQHGQTGPGPHGSWLLICGVQAAESTKVSLAPWNLLQAWVPQRISIGLPATWWTVMLRAININGVMINVARTSALFIRGQTRSWS